MTYVSRAAAIVRRATGDYTLGRPDYYKKLARIQKFLNPRTYVEIGSNRGASFALAKNVVAAVGIDPAPNLVDPPPPKGRIFKMTSDDFFARHNLSEELGGNPVDLAFIDGAHLFEFALRDFINLEKFSTPDSTILVHDCYPVDRVTAARERTTGFWSGDVWKLIVCLKKYRPDLQVFTVDTPPTGLGIIRGLDRNSMVLTARLESLYEEFVPLDFDTLNPDKAVKLNRVDNNWEEIKSALATTAPSAFAAPRRKD